MGSSLDPEEIPSAISDIQPAVLRFLSDVQRCKSIAARHAGLSGKQLLLDLVNRHLHEILGKFDLDGVTHDGRIGLSDHAERARGYDHGLQFSP